MGGSHPTAERHLKKIVLEKALEPLREAYRSAGANEAADARPLWQVARHSLLEESTAADVAPAPAPAKQPPVVPVDVDEAVVPADVAVDAGKAAVDLSTGAIEKSFELLGVTGVEDRLQDGHARGDGEGA